MASKPERPFSLKDMNTFFKKAFINHANRFDSLSSKNALDAAFLASAAFFNTNFNQEQQKIFTEDLVKSLAVDCHRYCSTNVSCETDQEIIKTRVEIVRAVLTLVNEFGLRLKLIKIPDHIAVVFFRFIFRYAPLDIPVTKCFESIASNISGPLKLNLFSTLPEIFDPKIHRFPIFSIISKEDEKVREAGIMYISGFYTKIVNQLDTKNAEELEIFRDLMTAVAIAVVSTDFYELLHEIFIDALKNSDMQFLLSNQVFVRNFTLVFANMRPDFAESIISIVLNEDALSKIALSLDCKHFRIEFGKLNAKLQENFPNLVDTHMETLSELTRSLIEASITEYEKYLTILEWMNELLNIESDIKVCGYDNIVDLENIYINLKIAKNNSNTLKLHSPDDFDHVFVAIFDFISKFLYLPSSQASEKAFFYNWEYEKNLNLAEEHFIILVFAYDFVVSNSTVTSNKLTALLAIIDFFNVNIGSSYNIDKETVSDGDDAYNDDENYLKVAVGCVRKYFDKFVMNLSLDITMKEYESLYTFLKLTHSDPVKELYTILLLILRVYKSELTFESVHLTMLELGVFTPDLLVSYFSIEFEKASFKLEKPDHVVHLFDYLQKHNFFNKTQLKIIQNK